MKKKIIGMFVIIILSMLIFIPKSKATNELDEIQDYTITIDMKEDGTMDMKYHIEWKVLDSTSEGPLEWVKIGVANKHVGNIKKLSDNIKKIKYTYDYGNYVRIDFKKKYYVGDIVSFDFSLNQSYMYTIKSDGTCSYSFTPGWFDDIRVKKATIKWNKNNVNTYTQGAKEESGYLVWTKSLNKGEKMTVQTTYYQSAFKLDSSKQAKNAKSYNSSSMFWVLMIIFVLGVVGSIIGAFTGGGSYYRHSGFGYYPRYYHHYHHHRGGFGGGGSSCACVSCACACACAGGGRAGCSKKDFYGTNLKISKLKKAVN